MTKVRETLKRILVSRRAYWPALSEEATALCVYAHLQYLRAGTGSSVEFLCDNVDQKDHAKSAVICFGDWTDWTPLRYEADTLLGCLLLAVKERKKWALAQAPWRPE